MRKAVRREFDPANPPRLTAKAKAEIKALGDRPDSAIDQSDIPELTEKFWRNMQPPPGDGPSLASKAIPIAAETMAPSHASGGRPRTNRSPFLRVRLTTWRCGLPTRLF